MRHESPTDRHVARRAARRGGLPPDITVTVIAADDGDEDDRPPSHLSAEVRRKRIVELCGRIEARRRNQAAEQARAPGGTQ